MGECGGDGDDESDSWLGIPECQQGWLVQCHPVAADIQLCLPSMSRSSWPCDQTSQQGVPIVAACVAENRSNISMVIKHVELAC